jgi:hypothetical protein
MRNAISKARASSAICRTMHLCSRQYKEVGKEMKKENKDENALAGRRVLTILWLMQRHGL